METHSVVIAVWCGQHKCSYPVPFSHRLHGEAHLREMSSERVNTSKLKEPFYNVSLFILQIY